MRWVRTLYLVENGLGISGYRRDDVVVLFVEGAKFGECRYLF